MATYFVPPGVPFQHHVAGEPAANYILRAFLAGTSTSTEMFTNSSGASAGTSITLDSEGYTATSGTRHPVWLDTNKNYKLELRQSDDTTVVWQADNINSSSGSITHDTVADMVADTGLALNDIVQTREHTAGYGYEGGNLYKIVAGGTGTDDGGSYIDLDNGRQAQALFPDGVNDKHFGAKHASGTDDTDAVMAAWNYIAPLKMELEIVEGDVYISDRGATGVALDWGGGYDEYKINMKGEFQYGAGTGIALRIGNNSNPTTNCVFKGLRVQATIQTPYEDLVGVGIRLVEVGECRFDDCFVSGFVEGYSLRPDSNPSAVVGNIFNNCSSEDCYYNIYIEPANVAGCFVTNNKFYGGRHTTPPSEFTDIVTANAHLISIHVPGFALAGNTVDGNIFHGVKLEERVTRRIYCEGKFNHFVSCYFDAGAYSAGNPHSTGSYPYRESGITGFTSDGDSTIHKVAHGLATYIRKGDLINVASSVDISDNGNYTVVAVTDDAIQLNKSVVGVGAITIGHRSADIEFAVDAESNHITNCETAGLMVITENVVLGQQTTIISSASMGLVKGAMPPLGTEGDDGFPGGLTDTPQPGTINLWAPTIGGTGTHNAYIGNTNDDDTDANVQLCFGSLDDSQRQQVMSSIMANKEGRSTSQPHGGIGFRTRAAGSNSFLVDRTYVDSNGTVSYQPTSGITAFAGGGQANATQLYRRYNVIGTVATTGDSVKLPAKVGPIDGATLTIWNDGANACDVFPESGGDLGSGANTAASLASGSSITYVRTSALTWKSM